MAITREKIDYILSLKEKLYEEGQTRHNNYLGYQMAYGYGDLASRTRYGAYPEQPGSPRVPDYIKNDAESDVDLTINLIRSSVEQKRAMIGMVPNIKVTPATLQDIDVAKAELVEKAILGIWSYSNIDMVIGDMAYYCALLGTAVLGVIWNPEDKRPQIIARSPEGFYCTKKDQFGIQLSSAMFIEKYWGEEANFIWPGYGFSEYDEVEVIDFWDKDTHVKYCTTTDDVFTDDSGENKLGFVPYITVPNISQPTSPFGESEVASVIAIDQEVNWRIIMEHKMAEKNVNGPYVVINPDETVDELAFEEGGVIPVGIGGDVKQLVPGQVPYNWETSYKRLMELYDRVSDAPEVLRGTMDSAIVTGKGADAMMGPVMSRIEMRHKYIFPRIEWIDVAAILMLQTFAGDEPIALDVLDNKSLIKKGEITETISITPNELGANFRHKVFLRAYAYLDRQSQVVLGLQLVGAKVISKLTLAQELDFIDNPQQEQERISSEALAEARITAQVQMEMQRMMQPPQAPAAAAQPPMEAPMPQPGQEGPIDVEQQQYAMERGAAESSGAPTDAFGASLPGMEAEPVSAEFSQQPMMGAPQQAGPQVDEEVMQIVDVIRSIKKAKGRIFLVGSAITGDLALVKIVELRLTDMLDQRTILDVIKKQLPKYYGKVQCRKVADVPETPYIEVTPGTQGYDIQNIGEEEDNDLLSGFEDELGGPEVMGGGMPPMGGNMPPMGGGMPPLMGGM